MVCTTKYKLYYSTTFITNLIKSYQTEATVESIKRFKIRIGNTSRHFVSFPTVTQNGGSVQA